MSLRRNRASWQLAWGLSLILLGGIFLFDRFSVFSVAHAIHLFWPVGLIALGAARLLDRSGTDRVNQGRDNA